MKFYFSLVVEKDFATPVDYEFLMFWDMPLISNVISLSVLTMNL